MRSFLEKIYKWLERYLYDDTYEELENKYYKLKCKAEELEDEKNSRIRR